MTERSDQRGPALNDLVCRRLSAILAGALLVGTAGCGPATDEADDGWELLGEADLPIVNGETDYGDPAVVALTTGPYFFCSGTLIAPRVVLTAAHCLPPNIPDYTSSYSAINIFFGTDVSSSGQFVDVVDGWTHPDWNDNEYYYDIGLLRLAQDGPTAPIPHNTSSMNFDQGVPVRLVGFGQTSENNYNSAGLKRVGTTYVDEVDFALFTMQMDPSGVCSGDSGGAALIEKNGQEVVAGVNSRSDCTTISIDTRVDHYQNEISEFIGTTPQPTCGADGMCAANCNPPDPDCPCGADGLCTAACPDVTQDPDCDPNCAANGVCVSVGCPFVDPDCPNCAADGACDARCAPGADPDCVVTCPADGVCDRSCSPDPDCWLAGTEANRSYDGDLESGCASSPRRPASGAGSGAAIVAALLLGGGRRLRRERRRSRRS